MRVLSVSEAKAINGGGFFDNLNAVITAVGKLVSEFDATEFNALSSLFGWKTPSSTSTSV